MDGEVRIEIGRVNAQPALIIRSDAGVHTVGMLHIGDHLLQNLYIVRNPDKLQHVGG
ncbi:RNA polymerase sigma factor SigJ [compost metagenome]